VAYSHARARSRASFRPISLWAALISLSAAACASTPSTDDGASMNSANSTARGDAGWIDLQREDAWRGYRRTDVPRGWHFATAAGELQFTGSGGDLITRDQFTDFELELEWKIGARGNSGIFFRANEGTGRIYENAAEMQVLDNAGHADGRNPLTSAGSNYALHAPVRDVTRPLGEWNAVRLVVRGAHVEQWLNGVKVVEYDLWTPEWNAQIAASKFNAWPTYARARRGHIGLQDHGDFVAYRNLRICEIAP